MFFQFSPPQKPIKKPTVKKEPEPDIAVLSLAPFTANPKIFFENIKVGQTAVQKLIIKNPNNWRIEVSAQITLDEDINLQLNWSQLCLDQHTEDTLDIIWTPKVAGSWRYILHITDNKRMKRDIPIVLKSISSAKKRPKPTEAKIKGFPRYVTKKASPVHNLTKKKSPLRRQPLPDITNIPGMKIFSPEQKFNGKENKFVTNFTCSNLIVDRRDTFTVNPKVDVEPSFDDSLENPPPLTLSFEDKLKSESFILSSVLTPKNEFYPEHCSTDEKSINNTSSFTGRKLRLFSEKNLTFELSPNISGNGTFTKDIGSDTFTKNISTETYTKNLSLHNISSETYTKHNVSSETYTKQNLSSETYTKDLSDHDLTDIATPPSASKKSRLDSLMGISVKNTIEAGLWSNFRPNRPLVVIKEEPSLCDFSTIKQTPIKRKSELTFTIPSKRQNLDGTHIADWTKTLNISIIDPETALWLENQQDKFKKWLNVVLAPPTDLQAEDQKHPVDVTKLWRECQKKEITIAPIVVSSSKLISLRKSALVLYKSDEIQGVLRKVWAAVDTNRLSVRTDRDIHLDLALQANIMSILLSYNPLWLRLGLETIYSTTIPLKSNNDIIGLTTFLSQRFIRNPLLLKKYKSIHLHSYTDAIKKYILKKFLSLIYFLDVAKMRKLIPHDPCLFCKNAPIKESREALISFARDIISSIGDITKYLKHFHYIVEYKQTYLDEFNYTVSCLGVDLRDGVRLTRVMEVILLQKNLSKNLRVPAISRLQKIHNMKIVFDSLDKAGFQVMNEIVPEDIVNGHKEKTLSFLWQIIYKFQTPLMTKSVTIITKWWRSERIQKKREVLKNIRQQKEEAASKIIKWYKKIKRQEQEKMLQIQNKAAIKIQSLLRMFLAQRYYQKLKYYVLFIEVKYIAQKLMLRERENFELLKYAVLIIQRRFRANKLRKIQYEYYQNLKQNVITMQKLYRHHRTAKTDRLTFLKLRTAAILIQTKWKATILMRNELDRFEVLKATTIMIQRRFRANLEMRKLRNRFLVLKNSVMFLQSKWKAQLAMRRDMKNYQTIQRACVIIQKWYRRSFRAKLDYHNFQMLRNNVILIQRKWRAIIAMRNERNSFEVLKSTTIMIQNKFRANLHMKMQRDQYQNLRYSCIIIQRKWRAQLAMRKAIESFQQLQSSTILIQRKWRALTMMRKNRNEFIHLKTIVSLIQNRFRAKLAMKVDRENYQKLKNTTVLVQRKWRAQILMKKDFRKFQQLKLATIIIQRQWRALAAMREARNGYQILKSAVLIIQIRFRANLAMKTNKENYQNLKYATIFIQRKWRAQIAMKQEMKKFEQLKKTVSYIKQRWLAKLQMRKAMIQYLTIKNAVITIQRRFRANLEMKKQRMEYQKLKSSTTYIQKRWQATLAMRNEKQHYQELRKVAVLIQRRYREKMIARLELNTYRKLKTLTIFVQRKWRSQIAMRRDRQNYQNMQKAASIIQRRYRECKLAKRDFDNFANLKKTTILVQRLWRLKLASRLEKYKFEMLKKSTVVIQRRFRANLQMKAQRHDYQSLKKSVIFIQRKWRAILIMRVERENYEKLRNAAITIQRRYRGKITANLVFKEFHKLKETTIFIQQKWKATRAMNQEMRRYEILKKSTLIIQRRLRATIIARQKFTHFQNLKRTVIFVQRKWREKLMVRAQIKQKDDEKLKKAVVLIQRKFRANLLMRSEYIRFQSLKKSAIIIQRRYRETATARLDLKNYQNLRSATILIQRKRRATVIMRRELERFQVLKNAAITIQRRFQANKMAKLDHSNFVNIKKTVIIMQKYARGLLIRRQYAQFLTPEAIAQRKLLRIQTKAAIVIQSAWRGYKIRSTNKPTLLKIYEKLKKANENAVPEKTLGSRCKKAIVQLSKGNSSLREILLVLHDLDFITRRCRQSLKKLGPVLPKHLYEIIKSTNRSPPEIEVSTVAASILINFYRYEPTRVHTWIPEYIDSVITVMLHCCDKETPLFPTLCTLMWFFACSEKYRNAIISTYKCKEKIIQIKDKCERKVKMIRRMSINYTSYFDKSDKLPLPSVTPDWGLNYDNKPRIFQNSIQALNCVLSVLKF